MRLPNRKRRPLSRHASLRTPLIAFTIAAGLSFPTGASAQEAAPRPEWLEGSVTLPFEIVGLVVGVAIAVGLVYFASKWLRPTSQTQADRERMSRARPDSGEERASDPGGS